MGNFQSLKPQEGRQQMICRYFFDQFSGPNQWKLLFETNFPALFVIRGVLTIRTKSSVGQKFSSNTHTVHWEKLVWPCPRATCVWPPPPPFTVHLHKYAEVGSVTSKRNGVIRYRYNNFFRAVTIRSDDDSDISGPVTNKSDNATNHG
jgi:hypothetical protein